MGRFVKYNFTSHEEDCLDIKEVILPSRASEGAAGYDIRSAVDVVLRPHSVTMIPTGLSSILNYNEELQIRCRSGLARKGIMIANGIGTIDPDYKGHIQILLYNSTDYDFTVKAGDRIAQGVFSTFLLADDDYDILKWYEYNTGKAKFDPTQRGAGGFGSTGIS